jgi:hypothetical protein
MQFLIKKMAILVPLTINKLTIYILVFLIIIDDDSLFRYILYAIMILRKNNEIKSMKE